MKRFSLLIPVGIRHEMEQQARSALPLECCGMLAGTIQAGVGTVSRHFPVGNEAASPVAYRTRAEDLFAAMKAMRAAGIHELAIYHSHPTSAAIPSRHDLEQNTYGESVIHVILGLGNDSTDVEFRGWWLGTSGFEEAEVRFV